MGDFTLVRVHVAVNIHGRAQAASNPFTLMRVCRTRNRVSATALVLSGLLNTLYVQLAHICSTNGHIIYLNHSLKIANLYYN